MQKAQNFHLRSSANGSLLQNPEGEVGAGSDGQLLAGDNVLEQPEKSGDGLGHRMRRKFVAFRGSFGRAADLPRVLGQSGNVVVEGGGERGRSAGRQALVAKSHEAPHFGARNFVAHVFGAALLLRDRRRHRLRRAGVQTHEDHVDAADCELGQSCAVGVSQAISFVPEGAQNKIIE